MRSNSGSSRRISSNSLTMNGWRACRGGAHLAQKAIPSRRVGEVSFGKKLEGDAPTTAAGLVDDTDAAPTKIPGGWCNARPPCRSALPCRHAFLPPNGGANRPTLPSRHHCSARCQRLQAASEAPAGGKKKTPPVRRGTKEGGGGRLSSRPTHPLVRKPDEECLGATEDAVELAARRRTPALPTQGRQPAPAHCHPAPRCPREASLAAGDRGRVAAGSGDRKGR
jgi:hypothetical protein